MIVHNRLISSVNGPGRRAVVWFQGCDLRCRGCWNAATHSFDHPHNETPQSVAAWILSQQAIEGVTFSGGEPMQQASDLLQVLLELKHHRPELSVGIFTGYNLEELEEGRFKFRSMTSTAGDEADGESASWTSEPADSSSCWRQIRGLLDFAVAGRFQKSKTSTVAPMRSSSNQQLHLFSARYIESDFPKQSVEITIRPGGLATITGFPVGVKL